MNFRSRHLAQIIGGVITLAGMHIGLVNEENFILIFGAYGSMFAWDKIEKALRPKLQQK